MPKRTRRNALIEDTKDRHVTFSKRRSGIFNKASELCTLCAVEMAIFMFSPGGKPHSFANPSSDFVIHDFASNSITEQNKSMTLLNNPQRLAMMDDLSKRYFDLNALLKQEKKRGKNLKKSLMTMKSSDIEKMNKDELIKFKASLEDLKQKVEDKKKKKTMTVNLDLTLGGIYSG